MYWHGLIAVGQSGALVSQRNGTAAGEDAARRAIGRLRLEGQRFDPQPRRIDDLEHDGVRLDHLTGDRVGRGDHAIDGRHQRLGRAAGAGKVGAALAEALELELGVLELAAGDHAFDRAQAFDPARHDGDLLIQLARLLLLRRGVGGRQRWLHLGKHVTGFHRCAEWLEAAGRRRETPTD